MTALAEIALLHAFFATVVLTGLHHPVAAAVRAPAVLSSHRSAFWHMPHNIIGIYLFVKSGGLEVIDYDVLNSCSTSFIISRPRIGSLQDILVIENIVNILQKNC